MRKIPLTYVAMLLTAIAVGQDSTVHFYRPEFMQTIFLDDNLLVKTCACWDPFGHETSDPSASDSCATFLVHSQQVYSPDKTSVWLQSRSKTLLSTYVRNGTAWNKVEYDISGRIVDSYSIVPSIVDSSQVTDTVYVEGAEGDLIEEISTFYRMARK